MLRSVCYLALLSSVTAFAPIGSGIIPKTKSLRKFLVYVVMHFCTHMSRYKVKNLDLQVFLSIAPYSTYQHKDP
jgi:hypothetical protein